MRSIFSSLIFSRSVLSIVSPVVGRHQPKNLNKWVIREYSKKIAVFKKKAPPLESGRGLKYLDVYFTFRMVTTNVPAGASTCTLSPTLWLSRALPSGDSFEIRPEDGLAS